MKSFGKRLEIAARLLVPLIMLAGVLPAPVEASVLRRLSSGTGSSFNVQEAKSSTQATLDGIRAGLEPAERWIDVAEDAVREEARLESFQHRLGGAHGGASQRSEAFEQAFGPAASEAVARLIAAMEAGMGTRGLSELVNRLLPAFRSAASSLEDDVEIRAADGPPGSAGSVYIADAESRVYDYQDSQGAFGQAGGIFIDLGGDDTYIAEGTSFGSIGGLFMDLEGDDEYVSGYREGTELPAGGRAGDYGHASFGYMGVFVDVTGADSYYANKDTFGAGLTGLFYEASGNDRYRSGADSNGDTGSFGIGHGRFIDRHGDDKYQALANAFGNARGIFLEMAGDDSYELQNEGPAWAPANVNSFGAFQGGVMVEYSGDDSYWVWQGNANFGANGIFVERDGHDWYGRDETRGNNRNGRTRFGFGSIEGVFVDLRGNDNYFAQDTSFGYGAGTFTDLQGDDGYHVSHDATNPSQGCVNSCHSFGIGIVNPPGGWFLDYSGDDTYETDRRDHISARGTFGTFAGAFIDRRGNDSYRTGREAFSSHGLPPGLAADLDGHDLYDTLDGGIGEVGVFIDDGGAGLENNQMVVAGSGSEIPEKPVTLGNPPGPDPIALLLGFDQTLADLVDETVCGEQVARDSGVCPFFGASSEPDPTPTPSESPTPEPTSTETATPTQSPQPETTTVAFTERSATSGQYSDETLFEARLMNSAGEPKEGALLTFTLVGESSAHDFSAATDGDGMATVTPKLEEMPGPHQLTVRYVGDESNAGSADTASFVVDKEDSDLDLTVDGTGAKRRLDARLSDRDTPSTGIAGRSVAFYSDGHFLGTGLTGPDGVTTFDPKGKHQGGPHGYEARFESDGYYEPSSGNADT